MKRIVLSILLVALVVLLGSTNFILQHMVSARLDETIAQVDTIQLQYSSLHLSVLSGKVWISDVVFQSDTLSADADPNRVFTRVEANTVSLDGLDYFEFLAHRRLFVRGITLQNPSVFSRFSGSDHHDQVGEQLNEQIRLEREKQLREILTIARQYINEAVIDRINISHAHVSAASVSDSLQVSVRDFSLQLNGLGYSLVDSLPCYNDSVFHFDFRDIHILTPDAKTRVRCRGIVAQPGGVLTIDTTQVYSLISEANGEYVDAGVDRIGIGGFSAARFNRLKSLQIHNIHLYHPHVALRIRTASPKGTSAPASSSPNPRKSTDVNFSASLAPQVQSITNFLTEVLVDTIQIHEAEASVYASDTYLQLTADSLCTAVYGLGYSLLDEIPYHYNDSVYSLSLRQADILTPDSMIAIRATNLSYENGGAFHLGRTRVRNTVDRWSLAHRMGNIPSTWIDLTLSDLHTSGKNILREAMTLQNRFNLDTVSLRIADMQVFRDNRFKPIKPYSMPQMGLLRMDYPFLIRRVGARVDKIKVQVALSDEAVGTLALANLRASMRNVTSRRGETIAVRANGRLGDGDVQLNFGLDVVPDCTWSCKIEGNNIDFHALDDMLYPMAGMKIGCNVHHLFAEYAGDSIRAKGKFCMEYDGLDVHAYKESKTPFHVVNKMSGTINDFSRTFLPKSNPRQPGKQPLAYEVTWKRNPWLAVGIYYLGPVINGAIETLLPGLFLHKRTQLPSTLNAQPQTTSNAQH